MFSRLKNREFRASFLSFVLPIICLIILGIVSGVGIGSKSVLMWDAEKQYINFLGYLQNIFHGETDELFYSLSICPGEGNALVLGYYMLSPFNLVLAFFNRATLPYAFMIILLLKIGFCGLFMYGFIVRNRKEEYLPDEAALVISVCYALNGYLAVYMANIMWVDAVLILPIMADGIIKLVSEGKCTKYYISLVYAIVTNFYMGYMLAIFSVIYLVYVMLKNYLVKKNNECRLGSIIGKYIVTSVLAVGTTAVILLPLIYQLLKSKMSSSDSDRSITYLYRELVLVGGVLVFITLLYFVNKSFKKRIKDNRIYFVVKLFVELVCILLCWKFIQNVANKSLIDKRFFTWPLEMLIGAENGTDYFPYELAHLYMGMLPLAIMVTMFVDNRTGSMKKLINFMLFTVLIMMLSCYDINVMMHGFSYPVGSPHRWTFVITFCIFDMLTDYLGENNAKYTFPSLTDIDYHAVFLLLFAIVIAVKCYKEYEMSYLHYDYVIMSAILFAIYFILVKVVRQDKLWWIVLPIVCIEMCINIAAVLGNYEFLSYDEYDNYIQFIDEIEPVITENQVSEDKEREVYRVESEICPQYYYISNYNSLYHYSSALTAGNRAFMSGLGYGSDFDYQIVNNMDVSADVAGFSGIKYLISENELKSDDYKLIYDNKDQKEYLYENTRYMPMVFAAPSGIGDVDYSSGIDNNAIECIIDDYGNNDSYLKSAPMSHYKCDITIDSSDESLYFLIPYDKGWHANVDGNKASVEKAFNYYFRINEVGKGNHKIEIYYIPPYLSVGAIISLLCIVSYIALAFYNKNVIRKDG